MAYVIMGFLGIPIWLLVAVAAIIYWKRRRFKQQPGVFPARLRLESGSFPGLSEKGMPGYCVWVHDVLLVHKGMSLGNTLPVPVAAAGETKRLGDKVMYFSFQLDDGSIMQLSGFGDDEVLAQGPFAESAAAS